jgi:hypothetical protein
VNVIESWAGNYSSDEGKDRRKDRQSRKEGRKTSKDREAMSKNDD